MTGEGDGAVAGGDGVLEPEDVADDVINAMQEGRFLITPHKQVLRYMANKTSNYDKYDKLYSLSNNVVGNYNNPIY